MESKAKLFLVVFNILIGIVFVYLGKLSGDSWAAFAGTLSLAYLGSSGYDKFTQTKIQVQQMKSESKD